MHSPASADAALLAEAIGVSPAALRPHSREPLGDGTAAMFELREQDQQLLYVLDTSRLAVVQETGLVLGDPARPDARIWLHPADPHLPALAATSFEHAADALLARLGLTTVAEPEFAGYRPGRRAVLRVPTESGPIWLKVVRPSRVERIVRAHAAFAAAGVPGPEVLGWSGEGLIVLENAGGMSALESFADAAALLDEVDRLRGLLRRVRLEVPVRGVSERLDWYAGTAAHLLGSAEVARRIRADVPRSAADAVVHGDLHIGQLFLDSSGAISAVIDVDTAGLGDPAEDSAAFLSHAIASALMAPPEREGRFWELSQAAWERWGTEPGMPQLAAVHLLGHAVAASDASDPHRAEELLRTAQCLLDGVLPGAPKKALTGAFESS